MTRKPMTKSLFALALASCVALSGCGKNAKSSEAPDELELPPEHEVADKTSKPKPETDLEPKPDEKVAANKVVEPAKPAITPPQDRDQNNEKAKMKRAREKSGKAKQLLRAGSYDKAIAQARDALREHEQNVEAMLVIAECFYKQGKHELVLSVTGSILKVDAKVLSPEEKSQAYNLMAFAYLQAGKRGEAFASFKNAAETDENNTSAWNNLGVQYMWKGDTATAEGCFAYAISLDAKFAEAQLNYGAALRANGKLAEAEAAYREVAKLRPDWAEVHFNLGVLYLDAEQIPNHDEIAKLNAAIKEFESYKSLVAKGTTSVERSKSQRGPTDAMGNELVSVAQADLYIKAANKSIESEQRRQERDAKRKQKEEEKAAEAAAEGEGAEGEDVEGEGEQPAAAPTDPAKPQTPGGPPSDPPPSDPSKPQKPGGQPSAPAPAQPSQPAPAQPSQPAPTQPSQPAPTQPSKPPPAQPSQPAPTQPTPTQPAPTQPAKPPTTEPSQPAPSQPTPTQPSKPQSPTQKPQQPQKPAPQKPQKPGG
jgi:Tfp pilus assembly protein PilF